MGEIEKTVAHGEVLVHAESKHEFHKDMYKTLDLLAITLDDGKLYFIVEGCAKFAPLEEIKQHHEYFYEEHTCPTNFIPIKAICFDGDMDPHGVFEYVDTAWLTQAYLEAVEAGKGDDYLRGIFPQMAPIHSYEPGEKP